MNDYVSIGEILVRANECFKAWRGTCKMTFVDLRGPAYTDVYECSECGHQTMVCTVMGKSEPPNYCPNCGRKVVEE